MIPLWLLLAGGGAAAWWLLSSSTTASAPPPAGTPTSPTLSVAAPDMPTAPTPVWTGSTLAAGYFWGDQSNDQVPSLMGNVQALAMTTYGLASTVYGRVTVPLLNGNVTFFVMSQSPSDPNSGISYGQSITLPLSYVAAA